MRFIHAGDFHLDSAFGAISPEKAVERRQEGRDLVSALADYVNENAVDLVLLSGDLLDSEELFSQTGKAVAAALGRMKAQVVVAPVTMIFVAQTAFIGRWRGVITSMYSKPAPWKP
ncbi:metallophosphoesterase [Bengtsoniella intestinalis]|uniref:metallophosphoesterase family protein n=1 Tax=Bengtsoniella intestinalis TaxID=3073143 RepID=UPI00391EEB46